MAIEDLDLEFEDENEKKGDGSIDPGVELEFSGSGAPAPAAPVAPPVSEAPVASLDQARAQKQAQAQPASANPAASPAAKVAAQMQQAKNSAAAIAQAPAATIQAAPVNQAQIVGEVSKAVEAKMQLMIQNLSAQLMQSISQEMAKIKSTPIAAGDGQTIARLNEADVKVAVAKNETEFLVDYISEAKLLEYKINQILLQVHAKNPAFQKEILAVKKLLQDHVAKYKNPTKKTE